ncbi:M20 family metallopeptidase [Thermodesulfobacteriota bacterium]
MIPEETIQKIRDAVDHEALIRLTSDLVKINSVWDPGAGTNEQLAAEYIAAWAEKMGFDHHVDIVAPGRPNVVIRWRAGPGGRTLIFEGHTDVVTPGDVLAWKFDPFSAEIAGNRMFGRGTNDTKGNLAALLTAMAALKKSEITLFGTIIGAALCDEEDQMTGVLDFIKRGHADGASGAIICEPQDGMICTSQKGAIRTRFHLTGRMSHGAMPLSGLNTATGIAKLIDGLHGMEKEAVAEQGFHPHLGWPSFTPTVIQAPSTGTPQLNVIPGEAQILVDIRTLPGQSHDQIRRKLEELSRTVRRRVKQNYATYDGLLEVERKYDFDVQVEFLTDRPCTSTDANDPLVAAAAWATRQISGKEPVYGGVPAATDGTFLWAKKNIPIVTMGAGNRQVPHQIDEWVDMEQLKEASEIYALAALHYLQPNR